MSMSIRRSVPWLDNAIFRKYDIGFVVSKRLDLVIRMEKNFRSVSFKRTYTSLEHPPNKVVIRSTD